MKRFKIFIIVFTSILSANDFTISDPPMIYIYHFVSYDTTSVLLHGEKQDNFKSKVLRFPLFNKDDMKFGSYFSNKEII